ncbi:hypothetical protein F3Y22_tig00111105pilonHSYRG00892 [Hibiscus syriacus]|uniref:RNase H type-1 domain-containing protein n=1 Tax=Hibiscus syriacus TaxID=106335 RepID=A0A6A2Z0A4_HIBSY|nr:hypothetical protein F3Y22_tig00111105pilonHSYRG00892 [Hibiscus syriacus]
MDSSFLHQMEKTCSSSIIRDVSGKILSASCRVTYLVDLAFPAEVLTFLHGLCFAQEMGFRRVIVEGGDLSVIKCIKSNNLDFSVIRPFIIDIREKIKDFEECHFQFVPRNANKAMYTLATIEIKKNTDQFWIEEAPPTVLVATTDDRRLVDPP